MKTTLITIIAAAFAFSPAAFAQAKKKEPAKAEETKPTAEAKVDKPLPMNARADELDAKGKAFTQINKDGKRVKHVVTDATEIKQGEAAAKFDDIKQGDTIAGLRKKTKEDGTEYEVVKITKFGAKPAKAEKADGEEKAVPKKK